MKLLSLVSFLHLSINVIQAGHLDSYKYELSLDCNIEAIKNPKQLLRVSSLPPIYPRRALINGIEAVVQVVFDTNEKGEVINERVSWSIDTSKEIDSNSARYDEDFSREALRYIRRVSFKPSIHNKEGILSSKDQRLGIAFLIEGYENNFDLGTKFKRALSRVKDAINHQSKIPKVIDSLDKFLDDEDLTDIQRASFLYLKAFLIYVISPESEEIRPLLIEMSNLINTDIPYGPNAYKVLAFGSILLGQIYINEKQWEKAIEALEKGIHSGRIGNALDERFFNAHLQLGIAHYSNGNWCGAAKSWARAKMMADSESTNYLFPDAFEVYLNYAENRLDSE